jgi:hypothetical protein
MSKVTRVELGCPGHCIVARDCRWRRHTQVGRYRVSSIGDYFPPDRKKRDTLGAGDDSFFETMVFRTADGPEPGNEGCGCVAVADWCEIDGTRYPSAGEAQAGHEAFVKKYLTVARKEAA